MQAITRSFGLLWDALFLQRDAYERMRDDNNPFVEGIFMLVLLGLLLAVAGIIGTTLQWASTPNLGQIQEVVQQNLQTMPWYEMMSQNPEALRVFLQIWDGIWRFVELMAPSPLGALGGIILRPLGLIVGWLIFGVVAYVIARILGGRGSLNQTLGATALAASPQLITLFTVLPFVAVAGLGTWTMLCNYMALRTVHDLSWPRAVAAAVLPLVLFGLLVGLLVGVSALIVLPVMITAMGGN